MRASRPESARSFSIPRLNHQSSIWCLLTCSSPFLRFPRRRPPIPPTDGVHRRKSAGTGPLVRQVARVTGAVFSGRQLSRPVNVRPSFPKPIFSTTWHVRPLKICRPGASLNPTRGSAALFAVDLSTTSAQLKTATCTTFAFSVQSLPLGGVLYGKEGSAVTIRARVDYFILRKI